jgi:hypothetical protein
VGRDIAAAVMKDVRSKEKRKLKEEERKRRKRRKREAIYGKC